MSLFPLPPNEEKPFLDENLLAPIAPICGGFLAVAAAAAPPPPPDDDDDDGDDAADGLSEEPPIALPLTVRPPRPILLPPGLVPVCMVCTYVCVLV